MPKKKDAKKLVIVVRREVFRAIKEGRRKWHHWVDTPYWRSRVDGRVFTTIEIRTHTAFGKRDPKRLILPWRGFDSKTVVDKELSPSPVNVIAIDLRGAQEVLFETDEERECLR